jgi:hypothetical protein
MKKVIDAGALRSPKLKHFLAASPENSAVLTDYAAMEAFEGNGHVNVRKSLEILSHFPRQVLVLKSTREITRLRPRSMGLQRRMIDEEQTRRFTSYCHALFANGADPREVMNDVGLKASRAKEHFDRLAVSIDNIRSGIAQLAASYTPEDLKLLRKKKPIPESLSKRIINDILLTTALHFRDAAGFTEMPIARDAIYSFPFRYALCSYLLSLKWISDGGYEHTGGAKLSNDFTDMTYAAFALFYDGLLTKDRKLEEIYRLANWMLLNVFR